MQENNDIYVFETTSKYTKVSLVASMARQDRNTFTFLKCIMKSESVLKTITLFTKHYDFRFIQNSVRFEIAILLQKILLY